MTCHISTSAVSAAPLGHGVSKSCPAPRPAADHGPVTSTSALSRPRGAMQAALLEQRERIAAKRLRQIQSRQHRAASLTEHELRAVTHEVLRRGIQHAR